MTPQRMSEQSIFLEAIEKEESERGAFLEKACGDDHRLRSEVEALLVAHQRLPTPNKVNVAPPPTLDEPITERAGTVIGHYKLLEQIGEGGFGVVFMAEQTTPVKRKVALKVLKAGMDTKQVVARFEAERQALAVMDHSNIAHVYDGGVTKSGRPYFVMELVKGMPITQFCDDHKLDTRERLQLFLQVCQAVQHAHQKGIIHRDIKPSNVIVSSYDGKPVVKVIDFGIAKARTGHLTDKTLFTGFAQMIGTPLYMSPEQAGMSDLDIDTRSDIYSLGVLLYELLTGTTPFDIDRFMKATFGEIRRIIHVEDPPRPSHRVSTMGEAASTVSQRRKSDPRKLCQSLRGELDWIVMKSLEKDRKRRYETAISLSADVQRFLDGDPVQACPPSTWYRLQKLARRHKTFLATVLIVGVVLLAAVALLWMKNRQLDAALASEEKQRKRAEDRTQTARLAVDRMYTEFANHILIHEPHMTTKTRRFLEYALSFYQKLAQESSDDPLVLDRTVKAWQMMGTIEGRLGRQEKAIHAFQQSLKICDRLAGDAPEKKEVRYSRALAHQNMGVMLLILDRWEESLHQSRQAQAILTKLVLQFPKNEQYLDQLAAVSVNLSNALRGKGAILEAIAECRRGIARCGGVDAQNALSEKQKRHMASLHANLAAFLSDLDRFWEAEPRFQAALRLRQELVSRYPNIPEHRRELAAAWNNLAILFDSTGRQRRSIKAHLAAIRLRQRLVSDYPAVPFYRKELARSHSNLSNVLIAVDRTTEAHGSYKKARDMLEQLVRDFPKVPAYRDELEGARYGMGSTLFRMGRFDEALSALKAHGGHQAITHNLHAKTYSKTLLAVLSFLRGNRKEGSRLLDQALRCRQSVIESNPKLPDKRTGLSHTFLHSLSAMGKRNKAETVLQAEIEILEKLVKARPKSAAHRNELAVLRGMFAVDFAPKRSALAAKEAYHRAIAESARLVDDFPGVAEYRENHAGDLCNYGKFLLVDLKRSRDAEKAMKEATALLRRLVDDFPKTARYQKDLAASLGNLGALYLGTGDLKKAESVLQESVQLQERLVQRYPADPNYHAGLATSLHTLGRTHFDRKQFAKARDFFLRAMKELELVRSIQVKRSDYKKHFRNVVGILLLIFSRTNDHEGLARLAEKVPILYPDEPDEAEKYLRASGLLASCVPLAERDTKLSEAERRAAVDRYMKRRQELERDASKRLPNNPRRHNEVAWRRANAPEPRFRNPKLAIELAEKAVAANPKIGGYWNTLGVAYFRNNEPKKARQALEKSMKLRSGGDPFDWLVMAMICQGERQADKARRWHDKSRAWMKKYRTKDHIIEQLLQEAARTLQSDKLAQLQERWEQQKHQQPPTKTPAFIRDQLTRTDLMDKFRQGSFAKRFTREFEQGKLYNISLVSGAFDTYLRLETEKGQVLGENDDADAFLNSELIFLPPRSGKYRLVVTSYKRAQTGVFYLVINKMVKADVVKDIRDRLDKKCLLHKGSYHKRYKVKLLDGYTYVVGMASKDFDSYLAMRNGVGKVVVRDDDGGAGWNAKFVFVPQRDEEFEFLARSFRPRTTGAFRLTIQAYRRPIMALPKKNSSKPPAD